MSYNIIKDLVSIIIPCYNCEKYLNRLLDSILIQDYKFIEILIVNDGSIDNIERIILSYMIKFSERNINLIYINQSNSGQSSALNNALKFISGEFLIWPDSDDW